MDATTVRAELQKLSKAELIERLMEGTEARRHAGTEGGLVLVLPEPPEEVAEAPLVRRIDVHLRSEEAEGYRRMFELLAGRVPVGTPDGRLVSDRPDVLRWIFRRIAEVSGLGDALRAAEERAAERRAAKLRAEADTKNPKNPNNPKPEAMASE